MEIRKRRQQLKRTLRQVAEACGLSPAHLSRWERGERELSPQISARVRAWLNLPPEEPGPDLPVSVVRRMRTPVRRLPCLRRADRWARILQCHPGLLGRLGNYKLPAWYRDECDCDSAPEYVGQVSLLAVGAQAARCSPVALGFLQHPLLDSHKRALGATKIPCLQLVLDGLELVYFPQVSMRTSKRDCRVDALVLCRLGRRKCWLVVEIDGGGHEGWRDEERTQFLDLPVVRIPEQSVLQLRFPEELRSGIMRTLG